MTEIEMAKAQKQFNSLPVKNYKKEVLCAKCGGTGIAHFKDGNAVDCRACSGNGYVTIGPKRKEP